MSTERVEIRIGAVNQAAEGINSAIASFNGMSNQIALMATKFNMVYAAAQTAFSAVTNAIRPAMEAVREFEEGIVKTAAMITSFQGPKGDVAANYQQAKEYAEGLWQAMEEVDAKTMASASDLAIITEEMLKQRVVLDVNNQKQLEAFANLANAAAVISMGYPGKEVQLRQEIRALMQGQVDQHSQLSQQLNAMVGGGLKEQVKLHKESGDLIEWMGGLLTGYSAASGDIQSLWSTITSTMDTLVKQVLRAGFTPAFKEIVGFAGALSDWAKEHREQLAQMVNRGWLLIKGLMEIVVNLFRPILESTSMFWEFVGQIMKGLGYIAYAVLPPIAERVGQIAAGMMEWIKIAFNLGRLLVAAFSFDWDGVKATWADIQNNFRQAGAHAGKAFRSGYWDEVGSRAYDFDQKFAGGNKKKIAAPHLGDAPADDKKTADKADRAAKEAAREGLAYQLQMLQESLAAEERGSLARIDIARKEAELIRKHHGERSREYQSALGKIDQMHREYDDEQIQREQTLLQKKQELQLIDIEMAREATQQKRRAGQISEAQEVLALQDLERKKFEIEAAGLRERAKLYPEGSREREQLMNQLEIAEKRHGLNLMKINSGTTKAVARDWSTAFDSITDSLTLGVQAMNRGTLTWRNAMSHIAQQVYGIYSQMFRRVVLAHLSSEQAKTAGTVTASGIREGVEKGSMLKSIALTVWGALKKIAVMAYEAAAAAYNATVGIPYVGPVLAPIAAAASFAAVGMYGAAVASAAGGWDYVDRDQMAMVHKREMILPADLADRVRGITDPGMAAGGGAIALTINAIDAKSVRRLFRENGSALVTAAHTQLRNFNRGGR